MIKVIIFDFDGVIHDTFDMVFKINKKLNPSLTKKGYKDWHNGNIYTHSSVTDAHVKKFFELNQNIYTGLKTERKIKKTLLQLHKKYDLFIISSANEIVLNTYFESNNIHHIFNQVLGYETHKSKAEKFCMVVKKYKLNKDEIIFVTDTLGDILEANKIGIKTIAVDFGYHEKKRLKKGKPLKIISDFTELIPIISGIPE